MLLLGYCSESGARQAALWISGSFSDLAKAVQGGGASPFSDRSRRRDTSATAIRAPVAKRSPGRGCHWPRNDRNRSVRYLEVLLRASSIGCDPGLCWRGGGARDGNRTRAFVVGNARWCKRLGASTQELRGRTRQVGGGTDFTGDDYEGLPHLWGGQSSGFPRVLEMRRVRWLSVGEPLALSHSVLGFVPNVGEAASD
jgi:hypothetical protein